MPHYIVGNHSRQWPEISAAFTTGLGLKLVSKQVYEREKWMRTLVTETARRNGVRLLYHGESYGYHITAPDQVSAGFLEIFCTEHKLSCRESPRCSCPPVAK